MSEAPHPKDRNGQSLQAFQIIRISEVPVYLYKEHMNDDYSERGHISGRQFAARMMSLKGSYGLVAPPVACPDLTWHSKDLGYVNVIAKAVVPGSSPQDKEIWTAEEFFPTNCLESIPFNALISSIFIEAPWSENENSYVSYVGRILGTPFEQLKHSNTALIQAFMKNGIA